MPVQVEAPVGPIELVLDLPVGQRGSLAQRARAAVQAEAQRRGHRYSGEISVDLSCEDGRCEALVRAEPD